MVTYKENNYGPTALPPWIPIRRTVLISGADRPLGPRSARDRGGMGALGAGITLTVAAAWLLGERSRNVTN